MAEVKPVKLSADAVVAVMAIRNDKQIAADLCLRVGVKGGAGCAGVDYLLGFDAPTEDDLQYEEQGVAMLVKKKDMMHLIGVTVDYIKDEEVSGFVFRQS